MLKFKNLNEFYLWKFHYCSVWALEGYFLLSIVFDLACTVVIVSPKQSILLKTCLFQVTSLENLRNMY